MRCHHYRTIVGNTLRHCHEQRRPAGFFSLTAGLACAMLMAFLSGCARNEENRYLPAEKIVCDDRGVTLQTNRYEYDDLWRLIKETVTDGQDMVLSITTWRFVSEDHAVKTESRPDRPGWSSQCDVSYTQGRVQREESDVTDGGKKTTVRLEHAYNGHGDPASFVRTITDDRGRLLERYSEIYEYEYTAWGKPSVKTVKMGESPSIASSSRTTYTYNVDFLLVSEQTAAAEGRPGTKRYFYDEHKRITSTLGDHPYRNEYFTYYDRFQGEPRERPLLSFPLAGTVNDIDVLLLASADPGSDVTGTLERGERVSVLEISDRIDAREGLRGPWLRIKTGEGREGWAFGFFIDTDIFFSVLTYGGDFLDPDPPPPMRSFVYFNNRRTRLYRDLTGFPVEATGEAGEQAQFLRQDNHLYQAGGRYHRFFLVIYKARELWVSANDVTLHYLPWRDGFFTAEENPVFRETGGRTALCLERSLVYTADNGVRYPVMPLAVFQGAASRRFTLSGLTVGDANGDGEDDIILRGVDGNGFSNTVGGETIEVERWARLRNNNLEIMFEKKIKGASGSTLYRYEYEFTRDDRGCIIGITETKKHDVADIIDDITRFAWNGGVYEPAP